MSDPISRRGVLGMLPAAFVRPALSSEPGDSRTARYRAAKFGMFIHWGPYSLASVEASWPIMTPKPGTISEAEYVALPKRFNPQDFDPTAWIRLARAAGQRYMVFTTKHHDGFCMFDSSYTDYKITRTPYGKDIVKQLADACRREGMPLGFYYSPPDMHHPAFRDTSKPASQNWNGEPQRAEWPLYLDYMELQLTELLTRYGDVAIIWFDGLGNQEKYNGRRFLDLIHRLQPATLVNNRIGLDADYETPEQFIPKTIPTRGHRILGLEREQAAQPERAVPRPEDFRLWETCMTINNTWAYNKNDRAFKPAAELIRALVEVTSRGGNFLLNVGPSPAGTIQPEFQERLLAIGKWLDRNGDSIYGTTYGPIQGLEFARTTAKNNNVYVHVLNWQSPKLVLPSAGMPKIRSAELLDGGKQLEFRQSEHTIEVDTPVQPPDSTVSVVLLRSA
ncbi:MAG TPA: alpha-L-fucosidase [Bryobacteraceae bacterium]|nr:alpha-L-fucosidase [Bryobacteraceae bacterium]